MRILPEIKTLTDTGYQGIIKLHPNAELPKKRTKKNPLTREDKRKNRELSSERVLNENVIGIKDLKLYPTDIEIDGNFQKSRLPATAE